MQRIPSEFGGIAGQALLAALRRSSWIAGMALASVLFISARGLDMLQRSELFPAAALVLVCLGLAHQALAAKASAATAARTIAVGMQVALVSCSWLVPWMLWSRTQIPGMFPLKSIGVPTPLAAVVYAFGCVVVTPMLLIAAARSRNWFDVASPAHWSRQFGGRVGDLMTVYTIQTGGLVLAVGSSIPFVALALRWNLTAALATVAVTVCLVLGYWVALAGHLCGSMHSAQATTVERAAAGFQFDDDLEIARPVPATNLDRDMPAQHTYPRATAEQESPEPQEQEDIQARVQEYAEERLDSVAEVVKSRRYPAPSHPVVFDMPKLSKKIRKTPLLDAELRIQEAMKRFRLDPSHTLSTLCGLNQRFAPNPHVLQALTICLQRTGHTDQAFTAARQAFSLCFEHGLVSLAAAMFYELRGQLHKLDLKQEQVLSIAEMLHRADELATAAKAYSLVIHTNGSEFRAVTGLLDVAQRILEEKRKPEAALKVYMFLLEHCTDNGMTEVVRDAISRCGAAKEEPEPTV